MTYKSFFALIGLILLILSPKVEVVFAQTLDATDILIYVTDVQWSRDGNKIAAVGIQLGGTQGYIHVMDVITGESIYRNDPRPGGFASVAWSPDNRQIAAGSFDQTIWIIDIEKKEQVALLYGHADVPGGLDWSPDGTKLVSGSIADQRTILWDMKRYEQINSMNTGDTFNVKFNPNGQMIATGGLAGLLVFPLNTNIVEGQDRLPHRYRTEYITSLDWNTDGTKIAYGTQAFNQKTAEVYIVNSSDGKPLTTFSTEQESIYGIAWGLDDEIIVTSSIDGTVKVWEVTTGRSIDTFKGQTIFGTQVSFSPYGGRFAYGLTLDPLQQTRGTGFEENGIAIVVPAPSIERLNTIAENCIQPTALRSIIFADEARNLPQFIEQVQALPADAIPAACAADLIAVAEAVIAKGE